MISVNCSEPAHGACAGGVLVTVAAPCITNVCFYSMLRMMVALPVTQ